MGGSLPTLRSVMSMARSVGYRQECLIWAGMSVMGRSVGYGQECRLWAAM